MRASALACIATAASILGCGGGGSSESSAVERSGLAANPTAPVMCGFEVGPKTLAGTVSSVHDGDTLTLTVLGTGNVSIRLESIDAPELAQPWGPQARTALSSAVLGKTITVAYSKVDQYGRTVGAVFDSACRFVNLDLVSNGLAWYYRAYQCEDSGATRRAFLAAQSNASGSSTGLWSQSVPEAPWYYRNAADPGTPTCASDYPLWYLDLLKDVADATGSSATLTGLVNTSTSTSGSSNSASSNGSAPAPICYVGPRGGTYTITASGNKNYGGC